MPDLSNGTSANSFTQYFDSPATWLTKATIPLLLGYYNHGVRCIRLCVDPVSTWNPANFGVLNPAHMVALDTIYNRIRACGMTVIIDFNHDLAGGLHIFDSSYNFTSTYRAGGFNGGTRTVMRAEYSHFRALDPNPLHWAFEIWNEPKDPGVANVKADLFDLEDSIIQDLRAIDTSYYIITHRNRIYSRSCGNRHYHITNAYLSPIFPFTRVLYNYPRIPACNSDVHQ